MAKANRNASKPRNELAEKAGRSGSYGLGDLLMTLQEVKSRLGAKGFDLIGEERDGNETGWRLTVRCEAIVTVYDTRRVVIQGRNPAPVKRALRSAPR